MSATIDQELEQIAQEYGFVRPDRGDMDNPDIQWKEWRGKPDYRKVDLAYFKGKSKNHTPGSLEVIVENLVKRFEMELTHMVNSKDWTSVDPAQFHVQTNGGREFTSYEVSKLGTYNWALDNIPKELYNAEEHTFESSMELFTGTFPDGFPWEVLEVFTGPPKVAFSWRHWGTFNGEYEGRKGQGEKLEILGFAMATVSDSLRVTNLEIYSKFESFLRALQGTLPQEDVEKSRPACCPIYKGNKK